MDIKSYVDPKAIRKSFLGDFYIDKVNTNLFNAVKDFDLKDNIIFHCNPDIDAIKTVATTLLIKNKDLRYDYYSIDFNSIIKKFVFADGVNDYEFDQLKVNIEKCQTLIMYDYNTMSNKIMEETVSSIISSRLMKDLNTIVIITDIGSMSYISENIKTTFKYVNVTGTKFNNAFRSYDPIKPSTNIVSTVDSLGRERF